MGSIDPDPAVSGTDNATETRRRFIQRARAAAAVPVVVALSMAWTNEAKSYF